MSLLQLLKNIYLFKEVLFKAIHEEVQRDIPEQHSTRPMEPQPSPQKLRHIEKRNPLKKKKRDFKCFI